MLGDFIRLTDYVAVEALVNLTVRTNEMFLTELLKPRKAGLFETTVLFTDEGTAFAPTCDDIKVRGAGAWWNKTKHLPLCSARVPRQILSSLRMARLNYRSPPAIPIQCFFRHISGTAMPLYLGDKNFRPALLPVLLVRVLCVLP